MRYKNFLVCDYLPMFNYLPENVRKLLVFVIGGTVILVGIVLIVLPGPAIIVIPAGLAILGTEFLWARTLLKKFKDGGNRILGRTSAADKSLPGEE